MKGILPSNSVQKSIPKSKMYQMKEENNFVNKNIAQMEIIYERIDHSEEIQQQYNKDVRNKNIENSIRSNCNITKNTKYTNQDTKDATIFEADNVTIEQVDKIPTCAVLIKMVSCSLCSCKGLDFHQSITHLDLSRNYLEELSGIENISGLEYANFSCNFITDISVLARKNKLKSLNISNNMIFKLETVSSLPSLQDFEYANNYILNHKPVITHTNFRPCWGSQQKVISLEQCMEILDLTEEEATLLLSEAENNQKWEYILQMIIKYREHIKIDNDGVILSINNDKLLVSQIFINYLKVSKLQVNKCNNINLKEGHQNLRHLFVSNSKIQSLQGIQNFKLKTLVLRNNGLNRLPNELSLISELTNLRSLNIAQNGLEDLSWLKLNQLESLDVSENRVKDVSALAEFKDLKNLDISFNLVENVEALRDLVQIEQLNISHNKVNNINCLNKLGNLAYFNITCNSIIYVAVCLSMKQLIDLRTDQNIICDIDKLTQHLNNSASWVTIQNNPTDIDIKRYFDCNDDEIQIKRNQLLNLKQQTIYYPMMILRYKSKVVNDSLEISNDNDLKSISFSDLLKIINTLKISTCPNIKFDPHASLVQSLIVHNCQLNNIVNLEQMTQLVSLDLSNNNLRFIAEIGELAGLKKLVLANNFIANLENLEVNLENLKSLEYLDFQYNKLLSIKIILSLPKLVIAMLEGNMIQDIEYIRRHQNYTQQWDTPQKIPIAEDYQYYLGSNSNTIQVEDKMKQVYLEKYRLEMSNKYNQLINKDGDLTIHNDQLIQDLGFLDKRNKFIQKDVNYLIIQSCFNVEISNLPRNLLILAVSNCNLFKLNGLDMIKNLVKVNLSSNKLQQVCELQNLVYIQELNLNDNLIGNINCLHKLINIQTFEIKNNKLFDVNVVQFWDDISKLVINNNFINEFITLFNHNNYSPDWISSQLHPQTSDINSYLGKDATLEEIDTILAKYNFSQQIKNKKKVDQYLIQKYKNQIQKSQNKINITNDNEITDLNIFNQYIKLYNCQDLILINCKNIKFDFICRVTTLHLTNSGLSKIDGIQKMLQLNELNLDQNNLENVSVLSSLIKLYKLTISNNKIFDLSCLQTLRNLEYLDISQNMLLEVNFVIQLKQLYTLLAHGNMIYHLEIVKQHKNYNNWVVQQNLCTHKDIIKRFGKDQIQAEIQKQQAFKNTAYDINMIQQYENNVKQHQITIYKVSQNVTDELYFQLSSLNNNNENYCEIYKNNFIIQCTNQNLDMIQNIIDKSNKKLQVSSAPHLFLNISTDDELIGLGFTNQFNLQTLFIIYSVNVQFTEKVDVKILKVIDCELKNINGLQNWDQLLELDLSRNQLTQYDIQILGNMSNLTNLTLSQNYIDCIKPLQKLINLIALQINTNNITNIDSLKQLTKLTILNLSQNRISSIESLRSLTKLYDVDLRDNLITHYSPVSKHPNYKKYALDNLKQRK
ncbi:Conserved_hypothetical protein [Hexamita inflata]|uniref:Uncharacterized protein n=1 Tax=Hexamita inflata TaxID=28002 RepID=A0AA86TM62_9EUKA|nr:Conserved hypothetical protein [Hexamita inflata]